MNQNNMSQNGLGRVRYAGANSWNSIADVIKQSPPVSFFSSQTQI